jgi:glucitol/sorbitol PTS system EIIA component
VSDPSGDSAVVYQTTVVAVGDQVPTFVDAGILVFFAAGSPIELHDICVLHEAAIEVSGPRPGDTIWIGEAALPVLASGQVAEANLIALGHVNLKADGRSEAGLPGDVCVPVGSLVVPEVGQRMRILRPAGGRSIA